MKATDSQISFLRILLAESFAACLGSCGTNLDRNHLGSVSKSEASNAIETLLRAKKTGWQKRELTDRERGEERGKRDAAKGKAPVVALTVRGLRWEFDYDPADGRDWSAWGQGYAARYAA